MGVYIYYRHVPHVIQAGLWPVIVPPPPHVDPHDRYDDVTVGVETVPRGPRNGPVSLFIVIKCRAVFNYV